MTQVIEALVLATMPQTIKMLSLVPLVLASHIQSKGQRIIASRRKTMYLVRGPNALILRGLQAE
jgi:hypothetical protein